MAMKIPIISENETFYGYIVGLQIERGDLQNSPECPNRMFARFEYGSDTVVYEIPDHQLFRKLSFFLSDEAEVRNISESRINKLWIKKVDGNWNIELP
jgi:hypothetical protein